MFSEADTLRGGVRTLCVDKMGQTLWMSPEIPTPAFIRKGPPGWRIDRVSTECLWSKILLPQHGMKWVLCPQGWHRKANGIVGAKVLLCLEWGRSSLGFVWAGNWQPDGMMGTLAMPAGHVTSCLAPWHYGNFPGYRHSPEQTEVFEVTLLPPQHSGVQTWSYRKAGELHTLTLSRVQTCSCCYLCPTPCNPVDCNMPGSSSTLS